MPALTLLAPEYNVSMRDGSVWYFPDNPRDLQPKELGGVYNDEVFHWQLPGIAASLEGLRRYYGGQLSFDHTSQMWMSSPWGFPALDIEKFKALIGPKLWEKLYPYQKETIHYTLSSPMHGSLIGLSPGLGKTLTASASALAYVNHNPNARVLVVAPKSLRVNWQEELLQWHGLHAPIVQDRDDIPRTGWIITHYDNMTIRAKTYAACKWDVVIFDESILVKNRKAARSEAALTIGNSAKKVWLLSGIPVSRYMDDLYAQFRVLEPKKFKSYWRFANQYCIVTETHWGSQIVNSKPTINPRVEFKDLAFVRNHAQVLPDLPKMIFQTYKFDMTAAQSKVYQDLTDEFIAKLDTGQEMAVTTKVALIIRLLQCVSNLKNFGEDWPDESGKLNGLLELMESGSIMFPCIIWTHWRQGAPALTEALKKNYPQLRIGQLQGGMKVDETHNPIQTFKAGKLDILNLSLSMGKYGHTLINARTIIYYDKTWSADTYLQSLARVDGRIGLDHSPLVLTLKCPQTADDLVEENLRGKLPTIEQMTNSDMRSLLISLGGKPRAR